MERIDSPVTDRRIRLEAVGIALAVFLPLFVAAHQIAVVWDEGFTYTRQDALVDWFSRVAGSSGVERARLFQPEVLDRSWRFSKEEPDGHGPFYCLLSLAGRTTFGRLLTNPASYRLGTITLFSVAVALVYGTVRRRWGGFPAVVTAILLASTPRLVPEVSFACIDGPLLSLALMAWVGFTSGNLSDSLWGRIGFGVALGCAMATKLTGWFLWAPYLGYCILRPRWPAWKTVFIALPVAAITVLFLNVGWWPDPVRGIHRFFDSNLTREETIPIQSLFLGKRYPFDLPWYNTLVWTVVAMPVGTLFLGLIGLVAGVWRWRRDGLALTLVLSWSLLMVLRALPKVPGHDGTRQILISFGFLSILAGYGLFTLLETERWSRGWRRWLPKALASVACLESVGSTLIYHPMQLSYYSPIVGGLPGAAQVGFEPTYFWDSLTPDALEWLNENTPPGRWVLFRNNADSFLYLRRWGKLRPEFRPGQEPGPPLWLIVQNRPGIFLPSDEWLWEHGTPAFEKKLLDVPVLRIFPFEQMSEARRIVKERGLE